MAAKAAVAEDAFYVCPAHAHARIPVGLECPQCINQRLEVIRNSVVENERLNMEMTREINKVFDTCSSLGSGARGPGAALSPQKQYHDFDNSHGRFPKPDYRCVQSLALGFQRLKQLNASVKTKGVWRATESMHKKQKSLQEKIASAGSRLTQQQAQVQQKKELLWAAYRRRSDAMDAEIVDLRGEPMRQITAQGRRLQHAHYNVVRKHVFCSSTKSGKPARAGTSLFDKPVLALGSFLSNDVHIVAVNTFLEDLIRLQGLLQELFTISNEELELPFLDELQRLLPTSQFYDSVQQKIDSILSETSLPQMSPDKEEITDIVVEPTGEGPDKIVIRNNTIHIPASFQTRNFQRRTSLKGDTPDGDLPAPGQTFNEAVFETTSEQPVAGEALARAKSLSPGTSDTTHGVSRRSGSKAYAGKRIIIVPHKFLTKPFTKLRPQEYLKFLSCVVKILVNFNVFLQLTVGHTKSRAEQGSSGAARSPKEESGHDQFIYDFPVILQQLASMDNYFKSKEKAVSSQPDSLSSASKLETSEFSSTSEENESLGSTWVESMPVSRASLPYRVPRLQAFYERFLHTRTKDPLDDQNIYGLVSEAHSEESSGTGRKEKEGSYILPGGSSRGPHSQSIHKTRSSSETGRAAKSVDLKAVTKRVHELISAGGGLRDSIGANPDMRAALSLMEQSKVQLEEWDVVSRMY